MNAFNRLLVIAFSLFTFGCCSAAETNTQTNSTDQAQVTALQAEMDKAVSEVKRIVNQPARRFARTRRMRVATSPNGWFHEGAYKPDFKTVDVRTTRETPYEKYEYITSDLNPGVVFVGRDLEFNSSTKYFYTDRTVPKKKLTEEEMLEINRLYRIIGRCEEQIGQLEGRNSDGTRGGEGGETSEGANTLVAALVGIPIWIYIAAVASLVLLLVVFRIFGRRVN